MLPIKCTFPVRVLAVNAALLHPVPASSLPPPHPFRILMNCTNLRLTSNPIFLPRRSQTITRGESCVRSRLALWQRRALLARMHTRTRAPTPTHTESGDVAH